MAFGVGVSHAADINCPTANPDNLTCAGAVATCIGTSDADSIIGTDSDDIIVALQGDDYTVGKS